MTESGSSVTKMTAWMWVADSNHPRLLVLADVLTEGWKAYLGEKELPHPLRPTMRFEECFCPPGPQPGQLSLPAFRRRCPPATSCGGSFSVPR